MRIIFCCLLAVCHTLHSSAQIRFEPGYFVDTASQKTECFIKNVDWKNNPTRFDYKLSENGEVKTAEINSISEFAINNFSKYIRADVKVDRSREELAHLSNQRNPEFEDTRIFLRVLLEGKASLFYFRDPAVSRYFYKIDDRPIEALVYKQYYNIAGDVETNYRFRQQLFSSVNCKNTGKALVERLNYTKADLLNYFTRYNECEGAVSNTPAPSQKVKWLNLRICPGLNFTSIGFKNVINSARDVDFGKKLTFRIGLEAEFVLPFNRNKWSILVNPTFEYYNGQKKLKYWNKATLRYKSIEFPVGVRHSFFLAKDKKVFLNVLYVPFNSIDFNSVVFYQYPPSVLTLESRDNLAFGAGFEYKRFSGEIRYYTNRNLTSSYALWDTYYARTAFIVGYKLY